MKRSKIARGGRRFFAACLCAAMLVEGAGMADLTVQAAWTDDEMAEGLLAHLTFDDEENGAFGTGNENVKAISKGENVVSEESFADYAGNALYLDGTGNNYLSLINADNTGVTAGLDSMTVSYWSKVTSEVNVPNWGFMIVDENEAISGRKYIASLDRANEVILERYNSPTAAQSYEQGTWKLVTAVFSEDSTELYIDGDRVSANADPALSEFLKDAKRFYIGGAENGWPNEYFTGYIDEFCVWNYGMTQDDVKDLYETYIMKNLSMTEEDLRTAADDIFHYQNNEVRGNITLPATLSYGGVEDIIDVTWKTSDADLVSVEAVEADGTTIPAGKVNRPENGEGDEQVTLTATLTCDEFDVEAEVSWDFTIKEMPEEKDYTNYVYSYFQVNPYGTGESQNIHLAVSQDGLNWREINDAEPVLEASELRKPDGSEGEGGVRDSYLLRSAEGDHFYLIATDLDAFDGQGWGVYGGNGSRYIAVWESDDLVNWYNARLVPLANAEHSCMWAPEATWDPETEQYLVYWSSGLKDGETGKHIWCAYTRDFYTFSEPQVYKGVLKPDTTDTESLLDTRGYYFKKSETTNTDNGVAQGLPNWRFQKIYVSEPDEVILDDDGQAVDLNQFTMAENWEDLALMEETERLANLGDTEVIPEQITYLDTSMLHYNDTYYRLTKRENDVTVMLEYSDNINGPWTLADTIIADQFGVEGPAIYAIEDPDDIKTIADALGLEEVPEVIFQIYLDGYGNYHAGYYPLIATSEEALRNGDLQVMPDNSYQLPIGAKHGSFVPITDEEYQALVDAYGVVDNTEKVGQVVYYDMETDEDGNLIDKSGNGNTGTFGVKEGSESSDSKVVETANDDGTTDRVLSLDGNGYVKLPTNLLVDENDLTISLWVKNSDATDAFSTAFYFGMKNPQQYCMLNTEPNMLVRYTNDTWKYYDDAGNEVIDHEGREDELFARDHYDGNHNQVTLNNTATTDDWALYTIMIDAESEEAGDGAILKIYYDGQLVGQTPTDLKPTDFGSALVAYLGRSAYNDPYFIGEIKEFQIWDRLWTDEELAAEYAELAAYRGDEIDEPEDPDDPVREDEENSAIATFSFDSYDPATGTFVDEKTGAVAAAVGNISITDTEKASAQAGSSLSLDGASYLTVTDVDGNSLLADYDQITVSYLSKVSKEGPNWGYIVQQEGSNIDARKYIGTNEFTDRVVAERFDGTAASEQVIKDQLDTSDWHLVTVVYTENETRLYVDREMVQREAGMKLSDFLGSGSTFQIGKADWNFGNGEFYQGYIDDFRVYNYALSDEEVAERYGYTLGGEEETVNIDKSALKDALDAAKAITDESLYPADSWKALQDAIAEAEKVYEDIPDTAEKSVAAAYEQQAAEAAAELNTVVEGMTPKTEVKITVEAPDKTEYQIGEEFDPTGMEVSVVYSDDTARTLTSDEYTVEGFDSDTAGQKVITVKYGEFTATFAVTVTEQPGGGDEPGTDEPGTDEPGTDEPGTDEPGTEEPGTDEPGTEEPGTDEPGTDKPGIGTDDPDQQNPSGKPGAGQNDGTTGGDTKGDSDVKTVQTGDTTNITVWVIMMTAAAFGAGAAAYVKKKRNR